MLSNALGTKIRKTTSIVDKNRKPKTKLEKTRKPHRKTATKKTEPKICQNQQNGKSLPGKSLHLPLKHQLKVSHRQRRQIKLGGFPFYSTLMVRNFAVIVLLLKIAVVIAA